MSKLIPKETREILSLKLGQFLLDFRETNLMHLPFDTWFKLSAEFEFKDKEINVTGNNGIDLFIGKVELTED